MNTTGTNADVLQQQKNGTMASPLRLHRLSSVFHHLLLIVTLLLSQTHITHAKIECGYTGIIDGNYFLKPWTAALGAVSEFKQGNDWCYLLYNIDGVDRNERGATPWNIKPFTFVAGGGSRGHPNDDFNGIHVCHQRTLEGCAIENSTFFGLAKDGFWRLDFVCCCYKPKCNSYHHIADMNLYIQFAKQLNVTKQQICQVEFVPDETALKFGPNRQGLRLRIDNCTRHTGQKESPQTPSRCRSASAWGARPELGCAHDGTVDRCAWTDGEPSGVCRYTAGTLECCCTGAYCNGEAYMNLSCRGAIKWSSTSWSFKYGIGACKAPWPSTPPITSTTQNGTSYKGDNTDQQEATTTPSDSFNLQLVWIAVIVMGVVIVVLLVALSGCCCYVRKLHQRLLCAPECNHGQKSEASELSGVTIGVDGRTESQREDDDLQPRDLMNPAEKADELRRLGKQAAGTSVTINPNEGSDFGDHTLATGGVFDDDSEAAPTTTGKTILPTTTDKATTNQNNTNTTTNTKAANKTATLFTDKSTKQNNTTTKDSPIK